MNFFEKKDQVDLVVSLVRRKMRTSLITHITGAKETLVRSFYREMWGISPSGGPITEPAGILSTRARIFEATIALQAYIAYGQNQVFVTIDPTALVYGYDLYLDLRKSLPFSEPAPDPLSINHVWVLARELRTNQVQFHQCATCGFTFACFDQQYLEHRCPACRLLQKDAIEVAPSAVAEDVRLSYPKRQSSPHKKGLVDQLSGSSKVKIVDDNARW